MPRPKVIKRDSNGDFISELLDDLTTRGILEQLRLECVADVKTKATYLQLKERMTDYITKKMSKEWVSDNTFREQVVECGVLALTVERIVDEVVRRKLHEEMRPLLIDLVQEIGGKPVLNLSRLQNKTSSSPESCYRKTESVVKKICHDTKRDTKKVFKDGLFAEGLATVSFSQSNESEDENMSDSSEHSDRFYNSNHSVHAEDQSPEKLMVNGSDEITGRSRRERKINPKYSSGVYHTAYVPQPKKSPLMTPTIKKRKKVFRNSSADEVPNAVNHFKQVKLGVQVESQNPSETESGRKSILTNTEENLPIAIKSAPVLIKKTVHKTKSLSSAEVLADNNVRKSNRPRKINSRIFTDSVPVTGSKKFHSFLLHQDDTPRKSVFARTAEEKAELIAEVTKTQKIEAPSIPNVQASTPLPSKKRYDSSDLYKPRFSLSSSRNKKSSHYSFES